MSTFDGKACFLDVAEGRMLFLIQSVTLCLFVGALGSLMLKVINEEVFLGSCYFVIMV